MSRSLQTHFAIKSFFIFLLLYSVAKSHGQVRRIPLTKIEMENSEQQYQKFCALCHGSEREGNAADFAPSLRSKSLMATTPLNFLASTIGFGRPNTAMAAYLIDMGGPLSMKEIFNMALWLQYKSGHEPITLGTEAVSGDLKKGALLFESKCAECHGKMAEGITAPALANPAFLAFATDTYIKYAIENGREETEMIAYKNELSTKDINDLTSYIRSLTSGWSPEPKALATYPKPADYILNKNGVNPEFDLKENRYVPMLQVALALENKKKMVILDTRTTSEWHNAHIPGAVPVPYYITEKEVAKDMPRDDTWIIAYCSCPHAASDKIINMLRKQGFKNTAVIDEGFFNWINAGYPVIGGETEKK